MWQPWQHFPPFSFSLLLLCFSLFSTKKKREVNYTTCKWWGKCGNSHFSLCFFLSLFWGGSEKLLFYELWVGQPYQEHLTTHVQYHFFLQRVVTLLTVLSFCGGLFSTFYNWDGWFCQYHKLFEGLGKTFSTFEASWEPKINNFIIAPKPWCWVYHVDMHVDYGSWKLNM